MNLDILRLACRRADGNTKELRRSIALYNQICAAFSKILPSMMADERDPLQWLEEECLECAEALSVYRQVLKELPAGERLSMILEPEYRTSVGFRAAEADRDMMLEICDLLAVLILLVIKYPRNFALRLALYCREKWRADKTRKLGYVQVVGFEPDQGIDYLLSDEPVIPANAQLFIENIARGGSCQITRDGVNWTFPADSDKSPEQSEALARFVRRALRKTGVDYNWPIDVDQPYQKVSTVDKCIPEDAKRSDRSE